MLDMNRLWLILSIASVGPVFAQLSSELRRLLETADRQVVRLSPAAFPELPKNLRAELQRRGCTIPQLSMTEGRQNVIKGEFAKPGQTDWAVLCSVGRISSILVFWNASEINPGRIAETKDIDRLQGAEGDKIVYSRAITAVGKADIMRHYLGYGGPRPPPIDHQGIDDAFVGKASVVNYLYQKKWLQLTGAD
jgi:hypothetical protein